MCSNQQTSITDIRAGKKKETVTRSKAKNEHLTEAGSLLAQQVKERVQQGIPGVELGADRVWKDGCKDPGESISAAEGKYLSP